MHRQQGGARLNEYFFTVGPSPELEALEPVTEEETLGNPLAVSYRPVLLDRFPMVDNEGTRLENGISDFCFPNGLKLCRGIQMPKFFCFVLTDAEGDRMYGNCLTIYEQASPELQARVEERVEVWEREQAAKAMLLSTHNQRRCNVTGAGAASPTAVSPTPGSPMPVEAVGASEGQASTGATPEGGAEAKGGAAGEEGKGKEGAGTGTGTGGAVEASGGATRPPKPPRPSAHVDASGTPPPGPSPSSPAATEDPASVASSAGAAEGQAPPASEAAEAPIPTGPVVEPVSPPTVTVTSPPEPEPLQVIFAPKCLCLLSKWPFISASRAWLKQLYRLSLSPNPLPLERYICNFLQEVPCPVPGKIEVQYSMVDQVIEIPAPPVNEPLSWSGLHPEPLFECLSLDNLLLLFNVVLLEHQVLFHSSQLSLLTLCGEVLSNLLFPLNYCHVYIPVLPRQCLYIPTNSPVPFLLGFHTDTFKSIASQVPDTVFIVDLDNNHITLASGLPGPPPLPDKRRTKLLKYLREHHANLHERRDEAWAERCLKNLDDPFTQWGRPKDDSTSLLIHRHDDQTSNGTPPGARVEWDYVRDAFLGFFSAILKDYRKYMIYPTREDPKPRNSFRSADFLASQPPEWGPFLNELCKTQAFQSFIDARVAPDPEDADVAYFDEAIEAKANRSRFTLMARRNTPFFRRGQSNPLLHPNGENELKTIVALQPDTTELPPNTQPFEYTGFPPLQERWYLPPRALALQMMEECARGSRTKKKRHNILRFRCDEVPSNPSTLVFSTFFLAYGLTIGKELQLLDGTSTSPRSGSSRHLGASERQLALLKKESSGGSGRILGSRDENDPEEGEEDEEEADVVTDLPATEGNGSAGDGEVGEASGEGVTGEEGLPETVTIRQRGSSKEEGEKKKGRKKKVRSKMRRLSEDLKEERLHAANGKLTLAFDLLQRMKYQKVAPDEMVFRSLIDACGRLGNVDLAMKALSEMNMAGYLPDASVFSCLVAAFAMNDKNNASAAGPNRHHATSSSSGYYQASQALGTLDWSKLRSGHRDGASAFSNNIRPKSLNIKLDMKMSSTPRMFKDAMQAFRKMGTPSMAMPSFSWGNSPTTVPQLGSSTPHTSSDGISGQSGDGLGLSGTGAGGEGAGVAATPRQVLLEEDTTVIPSEDPSGGLGLELDEAALQDAANTAEASQPNGVAFSLVSSDPNDGGFDRPLSTARRLSGMQVNSALIKYQVLYGESLLSMLFPDLVFDTECWTCFDCNAKLSSAAIQAGWLPDPNNYTTQCPFCVSAFKAAEAALSTSSFSTTLASVTSSSLHSTPSHRDDHMDLSQSSAKPTSPRAQSTRRSFLPSATMSFSTTTTHTTTTTTTTTVTQPPPPPKPVRRFVARFSVSCTDSNWQGSTGPGSLLWCEYLSPWVLRKEVQSIVLNDGIDTLTSPHFRNSSQASSTIFWNLVLWFRDACLPLPWLLQPSVHHLQHAQAPQPPPKPEDAHIPTPSSAP